MPQSRLFTPGAAGPPGPPGPPGPGSDILSTTITLTDAQIMTLDSVPVELVPAPGIGFALVLYEAYFTGVFVTTPYTTPGDARIASASLPGDALALFHGAHNPITVAGGIKAINLLPVGLGGFVFYTVEQIENDPLILNLTLPISSPPGSDSILKIKTYYQILPYPLP